MSNNKTTLIEEMKELLSDPKNRIRLDDYVTKHVKTFLVATDLQHFSVQGINVEKEDFLERMQKYEEVVKDLQQIVILLARWGEGEQLSILAKVFSHLAEADKGSSGVTLWLNFGWYPTQILMYSGGIAALSAGKYDALKLILTTPMQKSSVGGEHLTIFVTVASKLLRIHDAFKWIPGQEKKYVPRSEHLFQILDPVLEELLFIGKSYERLFDDFEVYSALVYAEKTGGDWGPIGRFGWKHNRGVGGSPFNRVIEEAKKEKERWPLLQVGMFNASSERFFEISGAFRERLNKLSWW